MKFTILTLNVNAYRSVHNKTQYGRLNEIIESYNADVICLQENRMLNNPFRAYYLASTCHTCENIDNTIFVKKDKFIVNGGSLDITEGAPVQRCAALVTVEPNIKIANVHLCGGRFDDLKFRTLTSVKGNEMRTVIQEQPDFIVGDFNAEANNRGAVNLLMHYPLFTSLDQHDRELFYQYYTSHYRVMSMFGYRVNPSRGKTSIYGGTPDHIYYKRDLWTPLDVKIIKLLDYTDHNAVLATFVSQP